MIDTIEEVLVKRDGMSMADAKDYVDQCREELNERIEDGDFIDAMDICAEYFGLEPDYLDQLIPI